MTKCRRSYRAEALEAAKRLGDFAVGDLHRESGQDIASLHSLVKRWESSNLVRRIGMDGNVVKWRLVAEPVDDSQNSASQRLWRALRMLRCATPRDLAAHSSLPERPVSEAEAAKFCRMLFDAGYLRVLQKAVPHLDRPAQYRLVRDTGPLPPQKRRITVVVDVNLGEYVFIPEVAS